MKQKSLLKTMLLLCALIVGGGSAWATDVTFSYSDYKGKGTSNSGSSYTMEKTEVSIENSKFYCGSSASYAQFYANGTTTIKPGSGVTITSVVLTASSTSYNGYQSSGEITASIGSVSGSSSSTTVTWTGSATADFTITNNKQIRWTSIVVTYTSSTPTCAIPTFTPASGIYTSIQNVTLSSETDGATIYYTTDGTTPTASSSVYSSAIPVSSTTTVKALAVKDGMNNSDVASATYAILGHAGTEADPYTVADARNAIDAGIGITDVYVTGTVCEGGSSLSDGTMIYWISDDGSETNKFEIFKGKGLSGESFTSTDDVKKWDIVVVKGNLTKYGSTYEFSAGSTLISLTPDARKEAGLAWSDDVVNIDKDAATYSLPTLTNPNGLTVSYEITPNPGIASESAGVITVDTSIEGTATVTASFNGNAEYKPAEVSYTINVIDNTKKGSIGNPYTVAEVIAMAPTSTSEVASGQGDIYVTGYIVGEYRSPNETTTTVLQSSFTTDANIAIADDPTTTALASSIPVSLSKNADKKAFGNKTNIGKTIGFKVLVKGDALKYFNMPGIKNIDEISAVSAPATITVAEYATFSSAYALDFSGTGITAYTATAGATSVTLNEITSGKVPANIPVVLYKAGADGSAINVPVIASAEAVGSNDLAISNGTDNLKGNYVLAKPDTKEVGFYKWAGTTIPAGKVYLNYSSSAREFLGFSNEATSIKMVNGEELMVNGCYDVQGRRVAQPAKGLYIVNGKKMVIK